jgi:LPS O-antigen subunit length determinant protein (WzzB/FepE family)
MNHGLLQIMKSQVLVSNTGSLAISSIAPRKTFILAISIIIGAMIGIFISFFKSFWNSEK